MLIFTGHSPGVAFAKATRAVGEEVKFCAELNSLASCTDSAAPCDRWLIKYASEKLSLFTKKH